MLRTPRYAICAEEMKECIEGNARNMLVLVIIQLDFLKVEVELCFIKGGYVVARVSKVDKASITYDSLQGG